MKITKDRGHQRQSPGWAILVREAWLDLLALLWPTSCVVCGAPDRDCCAACLAEVRSARGTATWVRPPVGGTAIVAGYYAGPLRDLLLAYKHAGRTGFAAELGARLVAPLEAARALTHGPAPPLLVTAPSSASSVTQRGYRHVDLIVRAALRRPECSASGSGSAPVLIPRVLRGRRGRSSQVGLDSATRARNAELVEVRSDARMLLTGREVVFVDDIVTTGATAAAACGALTRIGARVVAVVALCAVERRDETKMRNAAEEGVNSGYAV